MSAADMPRGTLRINAPAVAAQLVLAPLVAPFLVAYPRIALYIVVEDDLIDIVGRGFDAGVRYGENLACDMIAFRIGKPQRYALVAAPALIASLGEVGEPADLIGKPCIGHRFPGGAPLPWVFERHEQKITIHAHPVLTTTDAHVEMTAALAGAGFLITFEEWVRTFIAQGELVSLLQDCLPEFEGRGLYLPLSPSHAAGASRLPHIH